MWYNKDVPRGNTKTIGKENPTKPERMCPMKVSTLSTIYTALTNYGFADEAVMQDLYNEIHKGDKVKADKAAIYEAAKPVVFGVFALTDNALTVAEIWDAIEGTEPEGFTKSKLSYALTHNWKDEVLKVEGKVNAYRMKA